jgi:uncharacterized protein (TIGR03437 family)
MRRLCAVVLSSASLTFGQTLINRSVLSGNGSDQPSVVATDVRGFVYIAGNTTSGNFPVTNALETQPPQAALQVSINGAPFVNSSLTAISVSSVAASSDGHLVIASTPAGIFRSTDQGATWTAAAGALPMALALAVDPVNPSNAYALLGSGSLYKSTDGGGNWQSTGASFPSTDSAQIEINTQTPTTLYILDNFSVYRSTDGGQSWLLLSIQNQEVSAFALAPSQPNVIYATQAFTGPVFRSTDGGSTWTAAAKNVGGSPGSIAVDPVNSSTVWIADGTLLKSTDGGESLQVVTTLNSGIQAILVAIDPANPSRVYVSGPTTGTSDGIFETNDGGQTWSTVYMAPAYLSLYAAPSHVYTVGGSVPQTVFLAKFDSTLSQVIYSTYLWTGTVSAIAVDGAGDVYLAGGDATGSNGVVMKVSPSDGSVLYSTTLTGAVPHAIALEGEGVAVVAGAATSLAVTPGVYQSTIPGPCTLPPENFYGFTIPLTLLGTHAFVAKLNGSGALMVATYITGSCGDSVYAVTLDISGAIYLAGETYSSDFPITADAMTRTFPSIYTSGFVTKLSPGEDQLLYSSFLGGGNFSAAHAIALDGAGNVYLAGSTQASPTPGAAHAVATPAQAASLIGCPPITPFAGTPLFPAPIWGDNPFLMKMTLSAAPPAFLATLGGTCQAEADSIAFDAAGNIWMAGSNTSLNFPTASPIGGLARLTSQQRFGNGLIAGFLAELNPTGALLSATLTDSSGSVAADSTAVYYAGGLGNLNSSGAFTGTFGAMVAEIDPTQPAQIFIDEIMQDSPLTSALFRVPSSVAPGEIMRIIGRGIGPQTQASAKLTGNGTLATLIDGVQVTFNGIPAPLVTVQANQILAIAPFELNGLTSAAVQVQYNGLTSNTYTIPVVAQNTDILAVVNSDWSANSSTNPAKGSLVIIFLTGLGQTNPPGVDGAINQAPLAQPVTEPAVNITGNYSVNVAFLGAAAGEVAGVSQLNLIIGSTIPPPAGQTSSNLLMVTIGESAAQVYIAP